MSNGRNYLHSHSGIEREMKFKKNTVLVDEEYKALFAEGTYTIKPYNYKGKTYYQVPILAFVHKNGVFKNFDE